MPEKIVTDTQPKIFKIGLVSLQICLKALNTDRVNRYGDKLEEFADSTSGDVVNIKCPSEWLQRNKAEIFSISCKLPENSPAGL